MRTNYIEDSREITDIINSCDICFVGINDPEEGHPYVIPMNFAYEEGTIILHSGPTGKSLRLIEADNRVTITFTTESNQLMYQHIDVACSYSMPSKSVLCRGNIEFVEDFDEKYRLINVFMKKYTNREFKISTPAINNLKIWLMKPDTVSARSFGQNFRYSENVYDRNAPHHSNKPTGSDR